MFKTFRGLFATEQQTPRPALAVENYDDDDSWIQVEPAKLSYADALKKNCSGYGAHAPPVHPRIYAHRPMYLAEQTSDIDFEPDFGFESNLLPAFEPTPMSRYEAANCTLAGRSPSTTFLDLRSAARARKRHRTHLTKYYSYKAVKPGQLHAESLWLGRHHERFWFPWLYPTDGNPDPAVLEGEIVAMTKKMLFDEAQRWPRPPTYHRKCPDKRRGMISNSRFRRKQERKTRYRDIEALAREGGEGSLQYLATGKLEHFYHSQEVKVRRVVTRDDLTGSERWFARYEHGFAHGRENCDCLPDETCRQVIELDRVLFHETMHRGSDLLVIYSGDDARGEAPGPEPEAEMWATLMAFVKDGELEWD
ncbi:hypothetical protein B0A55_02587 [Friedmanniomyces simplex]|uniref:Uncharacterized protein n=1 Tax=Friedmanniomyces simplex TaxID=329884 RepID=A0A4U0XJB1_9PEZI|nr:hypothetical protein B0A55_02587 [Friedmanniomyces simplex]